MRSVHIAEWLLARVTSPERAGEMVGDLLEEHAAGSAAFNLHVCRVFLLYSRRWALAILCALFAWLIPIWPFQHFAVHRYFLTRDRFSGHDWMRVASLLLLVSVAAWSLSVLCLIRFRSRDGFSVVSTAGAVLVTAAACLLWVPHSGWIFGLASGAFVSAVLALRSARRPALGVLMALVSMSAVYGLGGWAFTTLLPPAMVDRFNTIGFSTVWLSTICTGAYTLVRTHGWLVHDGQADTLVIN